MSTSGAQRGGTPPPSWAGTSLNPWTPSSSAYNDTAATKLRIRAALGNAAVGLGQAHIVVTGASFELGYNGVGLTQDSSKSWPRQFVTELGYLLGGIPVWDGVVPATGQDDRWALTGGANASGAPAFIWFNGAGTATYVTQASTAVRLFYPNSNAGNLTWTIDGAAQAPLVPAGGNTANNVNVTGLANTAHTVVVTNAAGSNFLLGIHANSATTGIVLHNLALGGSSAAFGTSQTNWSDHTNALSLSDSRIGMLTALGITPDLAILDFAGNDALHTVGAPAFAVGLADAVSKWPNSDIQLVATYNVTPVGAAAFVPYQQAVYAQANTSAARLYDVDDVVGNLLNGIARGVIGPDNIHPTYKLQAVFGRQNALAFVS